jgi:hypothetical protein
VQARGGSLVGQDKGLGERLRDGRCTTLAMSTSGSSLASYLPNVMLKVY